MGVLVCVAEIDCPRIIPIPPNNLTLMSRFNSSSPLWFEKGFIIIFKVWFMNNNYKKLQIINYFLLFSIIIADIVYLKIINVNIFTNGYGIRESGFYVIYLSSFLVAVSATLYLTKYLSIIGIIGCSPERKLEKKINDFICNKHRTFQKIMLMLFEGVLLLSLISFSALIFTYLAASSLNPFYDTYLLNIDKLIGFNWLAYARYVNENPNIHNFLYFSYGLREQLIIAVFIFALSNNKKQIHSFILVFSLSLTAVTIVSCLYPALGEVYSNKVKPTDFPLINLQDGFIHIEHVYNMRNGGDIDLDIATGIITFPSFHTCLAIMFIWFFRIVPYFRWFSLITNTAMLFATPIFGGHYIADMIAGALITIPLIVLVEKIANNDVIPFRQVYKNSC